MKLMKDPYQPRVNSYYMVYPYLTNEEGWRKFIPGWEVAAEGYS